MGCGQEGGEERITAARGHCSFLIRPSIRQVQNSRQNVIISSGSRTVKHFFRNLPQKVCDSFLQTDILHATYYGLQAPAGTARPALSDVEGMAVLRYLQTRIAPFRFRLAAMFISTAQTALLQMTLEQPSYGITRRE
jgi:hypothetical protein